MRQIILPAYDITINFNAGNNGETGTITSNLLLNEEDEEEKLFNATVNGILKTVLNHALAGINVQSPEYIQGIEAAVESTY